MSTVEGTASLDVANEETAANACAVTVERSTAMDFGSQHFRAAPLSIGPGGALAAAIRADWDADGHHAIMYEGTSGNDGARMNESSQPRHNDDGKAGNIVSGDGDQSVTCGQPLTYSDGHPVKGGTLDPGTSVTSVVMQRSPYHHDDISRASNRDGDHTMSQIQNSGPSSDLAALIAQLNNSHHARQDPLQLNHGESGASTLLGHQLAAEQKHYLQQQQQQQHVQQDHPYSIAQPSNWPQSPSGTPASGAEARMRPNLSRLPATPAHRLSVQQTDDMGLSDQGRSDLGCIASLTASGSQAAAAGTGSILRQMGTIHSDGQREQFEQEMYPSPGGVSGGQVVRGLPPSLGHPFSSRGKGAPDTAASTGGTAQAASSNSTTGSTSSSFSGRSGGNTAGRGTGWHGGIMGPPPPSSNPKPSNPPLSHPLATLYGQTGPLSIAAQPQAGVGSLASTASTHSLPVFGSVHATATNLMPLRSVSEPQVSGSQGLAATGTAAMIQARNAAEVHARSGAAAAAVASNAAAAGGVPQSGQLARTHPSLHPSWFSAHGGAIMGHHNVVRAHVVPSSTQMQLLAALGTMMSSTGAGGTTSFTHGGLGAPLVGSSGQGLEGVSALP